MWWEGFLVATQGYNLLYLLSGTVVGLIIGALPGLGPLFAVALMLPLTFGMPAVSAIILLAAVHASTAYGDSLASILINTPGGVGSVASCWDGFPMAQQGKAGMALGLSAAGSLFGGVIGWLSLVLISPVLTGLALKMGPAEYFMLALLALSLLSLAAQGETIKGLILGGIGLLLAFIGRDPITATQRFTMGNMYLQDGVPLVPVVVGLFALSQAIILAESGGVIAQVRGTKGDVWQGVVGAFRRPITLLRGGIIGILLGIMPALGLSTANIVAYLAEKRASREPETFGKGNVAGLLAPETAKNACIVGDLIPTFTLGIPGSSTTALFLAALTLHGIQPGAEFFQAGSLSYAVFVGILLAQFAFFVLGLLFAGYFARVVLLPNSLLVPLIVVLSFIGAYAMRHTLLDVLITILFGFVGYVLSKHRWPQACLVLGFVLGDIAESNLQRALLISGGSYLGVLARPGALGIFMTMLVMLGWPYLAKLPGIIRTREV